LHQFSDPLHAYSHDLSYFPITKTFGAQQEATTLLGSKLRNRFPEIPEALLQKDGFLRIGRRIDVLPQNEMGFGFVWPGLALLGTVVVHCEIVGHPKYPGSRVRIESAADDESNEPKKYFLDYVFGVFLGEALLTEVCVKRGTQIVVKLDNVLAIPRKQSFVADNQLNIWRRHADASDIRLNQFSHALSGGKGRSSDQKNTALLTRPETQHGNEMLWP